MLLFFRTRLILIFYSLLLCGCTKVQQKTLEQALTPRANPQNVYTRGIPKYMQRVVLLPIYYEKDQGAFLDNMDDVFYTELCKRQLFEVVHLDRQSLMYYFDEAQFPSIGILPNDFIDTLSQHYQAQGILFVDLIHYHPFSPISVGVRGKLLNAHTRQLTWAFEYPFDSGDPGVAAAARFFEKNQNKKMHPLQVHDLILHNPNSFCKYVASAMFFTLGKKIPKPF